MPHRTRLLAVGKFLKLRVKILIFGRPFLTIRKSSAARRIHVWLGKSLIFRALDRPLPCIF